MRVVIDERMKLMSEVAARKQSLRLMNTYRGIPIAHEANILSISQGYVVVKVHPYQAVCLALEGRTYVQSDLLPSVLQAKAIAVDVPKNQSILTEFMDTSSSIGKRAAVRVQPKEQVDAEIYDGERRYPGKLADISRLGIGVFTFAAYVYGELSINRGASVQVDFCLPDNGEIIRCQGKVTNLVHQPGTFLHRLGLEMVHDPTAEPKLHHYITRRQDEILDELERVYESMSQ